MIIGCERSGLKLEFNESGPTSPTQLLLPDGSVGKKTLEMHFVESAEKGRGDANRLHHQRRGRMHAIFPCECYKTDQYKLLALILSGTLAGFVGRRSRSAFSMDCSSDGLHKAEFESTLSGG